MSTKKDERDTRRLRRSHASGQGTVEPIRSDGKRRGRNDPCGCGSGEKYKRCCAINRDRDALLSDFGPVLGLGEDEAEAMRAVHRKPPPKPTKKTPTKKTRRKRAKQESPTVVPTEPSPTEPQERESAKEAITMSDISGGPPVGKTVTITPAMAKKWLEEKNYSDNRPISKSRVQYYARQMKAGRWKLNGEPIILDEQSGLLNGQHRLCAIIEADVSVQIVVVEGVAQDAFTTMDQGYTRSGGQVLRMKGYKNSSTRSAVCRALYVWETTGGTLKGLSKKISPDELLLVQECYPDEVDEATEYAARVRREVPMPCGLIGLAHVLIKRARPSKADEFLQVLADGLTTQGGNPAVVFRKRLIADKMRDRQLPPEAQWCALVRSWNTYDQGKTLRTIGVKRNPDGEWVMQAIRGLGRKRTGGKIPQEG